MYENIVIDDTSVYEIDEQCMKCKNKTEGNEEKKNKIHTTVKNENRVVIVYEE